jgi:hypothetical protein
VRLPSSKALHFHASAWISRLVRAATASSAAEGRRHLGEVLAALEVETNMLDTGSPEFLVSNSSLQVAQARLHGSNLRF